MPVDKDINKVLIIGSGPIQIGQAAEFDYSGFKPANPLGRKVWRQCLLTVILLLFKQI